MKLHPNSISLEYSGDFKKLAEERIYVGIAFDNVRPQGLYSNYIGCSTRDNGKNILKWDRLDVNYPRND